MVSVVLVLHLHLETMQFAVALVLAVVGATVASPVPSGLQLGWGGLGTVVLPSAVSHSSSVINHGLAIPVIKPIISAPIITAPIIKTPIIPTPIIRAPIVAPVSPWGGLGYGWGGLGYGWGGLGYGWGGLGWKGGKVWH